jgi:urease accessory protein
MDQPSLPRALKVVDGQHSRGLTFTDAVVLDHDTRTRRRGTLSSVKGTSFLVDLPEVPALKAGDAFLLEDGSAVEIVAAPEPLLEVRGRDPHHMVRIAYHIGNRHLETEIGPKWLRIRQDHVIADMLRGLGARVVDIEAPFYPEGGAYGHGHTLGHDDGGHQHGGHQHDHHDHGHDHGDGHNHNHSHRHEH